MQTVYSCKPDAALKDSQTPRNQHRSLRVFVEDHGRFLAGQITFLPDLLLRKQESGVGSQESGVRRVGSQRKTNHRYFSNLVAQLLQMGGEGFPGPCSKKEIQCSFIAETF